jgi:hypothetical protein
MIIKTFDHFHLLIRQAPEHPNGLIVDQKTVRPHENMEHERKFPDPSFQIPNQDTMLVVHALQSHIHNHFYIEPHFYIIIT